MVLGSLGSAGKVSLGIAPELQLDIDWGWNPWRTQLGSHPGWLLHSRVWCLCAPLRGLLPIPISILYQGSLWTNFLRCIMIDCEPL